MTKVLVFVLCLPLVINTFAQTPEKMAEQIDKLLIDSKYQEAIDLANKSIPAAKDFSTRVILQNKKAEALIGIGNLQEAGNILNNVQKELDDKKDNTTLKAITLRNIGYLQLNQGRADLAEESIENSLELFTSAGSPDCLDAAQAHGNMGLMFMSQGKYKQAEEQLQRCLALRQQQLQPSDERIAATYNDLGLACVKLDPDRGIDYYEKALESYERIHGNEHLKIAIANINIGYANRELKLYGDAVINFETALTILEKNYPQPHPSKAVTYFNLGQTYLKMGDNKAAMDFYKKALEMYKLSYGTHHPDITQVLNAMGNLEHAENRYASAFEHYQQALQANVPDFTDSTIDSNPSPDNNYYNGNLLVQTLLFKAENYEGQYLGKTIKFSDLQKSLDLLSQCDKLVDQLRRTSNNEGDKLFLGLLANEVYSAGVRIAYTAAINAVKKAQYFEKAFYFAEKSKNAVLLDAISESNAKSYAGIPANLLEKEKEIKSSIALFSQKLAQRPEPNEEKKIRENLFTLSKSYEEFIKSLETSYPEYFNLKYNLSLPSLSQVQSVLDEKSIVLSYFIDENENTHTLYTFIISNKKYKIEEQVLDADFDKTVTGYRNSLYYDDRAIFIQTSTALGRQLIPRKISSSIVRLIILPAGRLGIIPFEPLLTEEVEITGYKALPYLINKYSVQYEFSAGLLLQKAQAKSFATNVPSILLCAPVKFPEKDRLMELPGTKNEVEDISTLFAAKNYNNSLFTGMDASETLIKTTDLNKYSYLHLATHGVVDESEPELSRIYLQTNSAKEDGNLFAGEIYNLKLNANLVTLSACQTGLGKISKGEGVIGLSRALIYAGAQHLIVSFWSVADESTALLMKNFYAEMLDSGHKTFEESLRVAKLKMITDEKYATPFYWAPFILIGY